MQVVNTLVVVDQLRQYPAVVLQCLLFDHQKVLRVLLDVVLACCGQDDDPFGVAVDFGGMLQVF